MSEEIRKLRRLIETRRETATPELHEMLDSAEETLENLTAGRRAPKRGTLRDIERWINTLGI